MLSHSNSPIGEMQGIEFGGEVNLATVAIGGSLKSADLVVDDLHSPARHEDRSLLAGCESAPPREIPARHTGLCLGLYVAQCKRRLLQASARAVHSNAVCSDPVFAATLFIRLSISFSFGVVTQPNQEQPNETHGKEQRTA